MTIDRAYIEKEFQSFIDFPTEDKRFVTAVSAKLFAEHIATPCSLEAERLKTLVAEMLAELKGVLAEMAVRIHEAEGRFPSLAEGDDEQSLREFEESRVTRISELVSRAKLDA